MKATAALRIVYKTEDTRLHCASALISARRSYLRFFSRLTLLRILSACSGVKASVLRCAFLKSTDCRRGRMIPFSE